MRDLNPKKISLLLILTLIPWGFAIAPVKSETVPIRALSELTPLPQPSGRLQDLQQVENRSPMDWSWQNVLSENSQREETSYTINSYTGPSIQPIQEFEEWKRLNQGDPKRDSPGIPLTRF